jgi:uncharacterized membrane protein YbhN (UPF0104 family)
MTLRTLLAAASTAALGLCLTVWIASGGFADCLDALAAADRSAAAWAAGAFAVSMLASACAWHVAFSAVGSEMRRPRACATYSVGSLVNTFAPATVGESLRGVLFARALPDERGRGCTAVGAVGAVTVARAAIQLVVISCAVLVAGFPRWIVLVPFAFAALGVGAVLVLRRRAHGSRLRRLGETGAVLVRRPSYGIRVLGWVALATAARITAASAVASSVGIAEPVTAGLAVTAALALAALLPITPGSIGITSGAISLVLVQAGASLPTALAAGVLFHAVEAAVNVTVGLVGTPFVLGTAAFRRRSVHVAFAGAGAAVLAAAVLGAGLVVYLPFDGV